MTGPVTTPTADASDDDLSALFDLHRPGVDVAAAFDAIAGRFDRYHPGYLGFPVARRPLPHSARVGEGRFFNNIGLVGHPPLGYQHAMEAEHAVLTWLAAHLGIPEDRWWGHLTTGGSGGTYAGIRNGRHQYPDATLLYCDTAHYSVPAAGDDLRIPAHPISSSPSEQMNLAAFAHLIGDLARDRPDDLAVIVVATWGTTRTEACDDLPGIIAVLDQHHVHRRYIHIDAALSGIPLALDGHRLDGADSFSTSAYKFLGTNEAAGIFLGRRAAGTADASGRTADRHISYTGTVATTGVRSGLAALRTWEAIATLGDAGLRASAHASRELADYTITQLRQLGVPAWRHATAYFTVVTARLPDILDRRWTLGPNGDGQHRIVLVPGRDRQQVDAFLADLRGALANGRRPAVRPNPFAGFATPEVTR